MFGGKIECYTGGKRSAIRGAVLAGISPGFDWYDADEVTSRAICRAAHLVLKYPNRIIIRYFRNNIIRYA